MADDRKGSSSRVLGWISLSLLVLAAVTVVVPLVLYVLATSDKGMPVGDGPTDVHAPGDRPWGIYFDDRDNSGYSESCTVTDSKGRPVSLRNPGITQFLEHRDARPRLRHPT